LALSSLEEPWPSGLSSVITLMFSKASVLPPFWLFSNFLWVPNLTLVVEDEPESSEEVDVDPLEVLPLLELVDPELEEEPPDGCEAML